MSTLHFRVDVDGIPHETSEQVGDLSRHQLRADAACRVLDKYMDRYDTASVTAYELNAQGNRVFKWTRDINGTVTGSHF